MFITCSVNMLIQNVLKSTTQSLTPDQGKAPTRATKLTNRSRLWDQKFGTKDTKFMAKPHDILTGYSTVVM